ncbi:MAG: MarR family transcriptional regulator [Actinomycetota bacterium]
MDVPDPEAASDQSEAEARLLDAERVIQARLGDQPVDFDSLHAVSNIYRAATAVRRRAERELLAPQGLSWGGFTIVWVLWVWGEMETAQLASECDLAKGTLTGMVSTLEKQQLVARTRMERDRRRVTVALTPQGRAMIEELHPRFHRFEIEMVHDLSAEDRRSLARFLRLVITSAER